MATTRGMTKTRSSKRSIYRTRVKNSRCRKLGPATCRRTSGCKRANGTKRKFCRKTKNSRV
jgi:hypothetical protein